MHLLAATPGTVSDGTEPVDPGQTPADILFLSAADTELALLSEARAQMDAAPSLRLTQLSWLAHPFSVDLYLTNTAERSRLVIARVLGGQAYWTYGVEQFAARLRAAGVPLVLLPGDDKPDAELAGLSTVSAQDYAALWAYCVEGGVENAGNLLRYAKAMLDGGAKPEPARPLLRAGLYWPGAGTADLDLVRATWQPDRPTAALVFYRALVQGAGLHPVNRLVKALLSEGVNPLPIFVASLKDPVSAATLAALFEQAPPSVVLNATGFAVSSPAPHAWDGPRAATPLDAPGAPVLQVVFSGSSAEAWETSAQGLGARDIAMNVALPEVDGRVLSRAVSFKGEAYRDDATECAIPTYRAQGDRVTFVAKLAAKWAALAQVPVGDKRVALILANYPNKDGRLANGVGLDTPASAVHVLGLLARNGYGVTDAPRDSADLMARVQAGPTNWLPDRAARTGGARLSLEAYMRHYSALPWEVRDSIEGRWGPPQDDPFLAEDGFALSVLSFGNVVVGLQPARGYEIDPEETYHSPDLVPPHHYLAFYLWLRDAFGAQAIVHLGKHGNLEWLPGKAVGLSQTCWPELALGPMPHLYPFIVNDPGEGTQAKRRAQAVIIDHLTPPMTRAETYGPLRDLEALVDEYYQAAGVDARRVTKLREDILALTASSGIEADLGLKDADADARLARLDSYLCELKEAQIRDGLHVFGQSPEGRLQRDLLAALARVPRGAGAGADASLIRALAEDLNLGFDPLTCEMGEAYGGPKPKALALSDDAWRSCGDTVERLELLALNLIEGASVEADWTRTAAVMDGIETRLRPALEACGPSEGSGLLRGLSGRFVAPAPSGAPTRGRPDVLPTGRNFFSVDSRAIPTRTAWSLGWHSASLLVERYLQDHGDWPRAMALTAWGTANMRTGGDDIAQALALMGVKPQWDDMSGRVTGFEILPLGVLGRPRVDVTLRISGFFRDAFPAQVDLVASAAAAVQALDEDKDQNPAAHAPGPSHRVFGSKPGAYGAGLQALIDSRHWQERSDLADAFLEWGSYAYGAGAQGTVAREALVERLSTVDAVVQNQDNREHDLLDSDDYYQFEGGLLATAETLQGRSPAAYHNDHSRPERPVIRTLQDEIGRVVRARAANPKWIAGVKRHGYKGAFEIAATVDYLFAFAATTRAVGAHHFDSLEAAYLEDDDTRAFIAQANPSALREIAQRFQEALDRGLWQPRSNSARTRIAQILEGS